MNPFLPFLLLAATGVDEEPNTLAIESYIRPPTQLEESVLAPWHRNVSVSNIGPAGTHFIESVSDGLPPLERLARPHAYLAGVGIDLQAYRGRSDTTRSDAGLRIHPLDGGEPVRVDLPDGLRVSNAEWSPDGETIAFIGHRPEGSWLYTCDPDDGDTQRLTDRQLMLTLVDDFAWNDGGDALVAVLVPDDSERPDIPDVALSPTVRLSTPKSDSMRTYQGLLESVTDNDLLRHYTTGQLAVVSLDGDVDEVGEPAMYSNVTPGWDGEFFRVTVVREPFSYLVTVRSFGDRETLIDRDGRELALIDESDLPFASDDDDDEDEKKPKRQLDQHPHEPGLVYLQEPEEDEGDRLILWAAPFGEDDTRLLYEFEEKQDRVMFTEDPNLILAVDSTNDTTTTRAIWLDASHDPVVVTEVKDDEEAFYTDPGNSETKVGLRGQRVVRLAEGNTLILTGTQYYKDPMQDAPRPFADTFDLDTAEKTRVWQSPAESYEQITLLDDELVRYVINAQDARTVPQDFLAADGNRTQITHNVNYNEEVTLAETHRFKVTRADGESFWYEVTVPRNAYDPDELPAMFWFYPREYDDQDEYAEDQRRYNKNDFPRVSSSNIKHLLVQNYVIVQPDCPIFGPISNVNDTFVHQLRMNMYAIIEELERRELADTTRLGIGGHSYGAFGTANAMIHTPFFKAGIAGAGNYNRVLTPFGFQSERRSLWEGTEVYTDVSAIFHANKLTGALLMYHGIEDQNMGTFPINSERMFQALEALGKTAALYMYPYEEHGQISKETRLDMWARWSEWLERYVKNADQQSEDPVPSVGAR